LIKGLLGPGTEAVGPYVFELVLQDHHGIASLYETFVPKEARRIVERLDIHYTQKQGRWLNAAEIVHSVLKDQCINRRIPDMTTIQTQVAAWERDRNNSANCLAIRNSGRSDQTETPLSAII